MCDPTGITYGVIIGAATGAISSAITGGNVLQGALLGGVTGGFTGGLGGGFGGGSIGGISDTVGSFLLGGSPALVNTAFGGIQLTTLVGSAAISLGTGLAKGFLGNLTEGTPEYQNAFQQLGHQEAVRPSITTGSGGRDAKTSLALAVQRAQKRKLTQEDVQELSVDTSSFASEGLQIA
jgi:hypothetical protein